ncbi:MAG: glycerol-3-phosphate dehydrogenase [Tepidanaerobacteraceae bacterium]|nr:glycerol-3-phosphate dehydrogenase [Tepidanaerobacteraceae bacterium]
MGKVTVLGAGVMGTALAIHLAKQKNEVKLWGTRWDTSTIENYRATGRCEKLNSDIPQSVEFFMADELEKALQDSSIIILAVTSDGIRDITNSISGYIDENVIIANIAKGIEEESLMTMSEIIEDCLAGQQKNIPVVKIGGPLRAIEVANEVFSEAIFASKNIEAARVLQKAFKAPYFKSNVTQDIIGVEICAALKNSYAITIGICEGMYENMDNPKAALIARGCMELAALVKAKGGDVETALGLAGVGDLYVTSQGGRNRTLGKLLGQGKTMKEAVEEMKNQTVEGYPAAKVGYKLAATLEQQGKLNLSDVSLLVELYRILYEGKPAVEALKDYWSN